MAERSDGQLLVALREQAIDKLTELREEIDVLNEALQQAVPDDIDVPPIQIPEAQIDEGVHGTPLVSSADDWADASRALIERKRYVGDTAGGER